MNDEDRKHNLRLAYIAAGTILICVLLMSSCAVQVWS